jgi:hypothetical protein
MANSSLLKPWLEPDTLLSLLPLLAGGGIALWVHGRRARNPRRKIHPWSN